MSISIGQRPMKWEHMQIQALKGRKPNNILLSPFQGLQLFCSPITGRCPVLMILPLQGIGYVQSA